MSTIPNLKDYQIPQELITSLLSTYKNIGRNDYFILELGEKLDGLENQSVNIDTLAIANLIGIELSDDRKRLILEKDSTPRTNDEKAFLNIKIVLKSLNKRSTNLNDTDIISPDVLDYLKMLSKKEIKFNGKPLLINQSNINVRSYFNDLMAEMNRSFAENKIEKILISITTYLELTQIKPFDRLNEIAPILVLYYLLQRSGVIAIRYSNFFKTLLDDQNHLTKLITIATYNYDSGKINLNEIYKYFLDTVEASYKNLNDQLSSYLIFKRSHKGYYIETIILKELPDIFSKEDIKKACPDVSESTIQRALNALKESNDIIPLGTGRNAKWQKTHENVRF